MAIDFDVIFKPTIIAAKANSSHPSILKNLKWFISFFFAHSLFTIGFFCMVYNIKIGIEKNDFSAICRNGCCGTMYLVNTFQYCVMGIYQNEIYKIINNIKADFTNPTNSAQDEEVLLRYAKKGRSVSIQWLVVSTLGFGVFPIKTITLYIRNYIMSYDFELIPFFELDYPAFIENKKDNLAVYFICYFKMGYFAAYSAIMYAGFVPLGPIFMLHACALLELLKTRIDNLFDESSHVDVNVELRSIVCQLQYIYSFVDDINHCFKFFYEINLKTTSIILPVAVYEVIESYHIGNVSIEFVVFIVGAIMLTYTPCLYSDLLMDKGEELRQAVYACGWERHYDPSARRARSTLFIILTRAVRPIAIRTLFRTLSLDALTDFCHQSYAIFNLMNAMLK